MPSVCRHERRTLPSSSSVAARALPRTTQGFHSLGSNSLQQLHTARQPFRRRIALSTTCQHANDLRLPCRKNRPGSRPASTEATLPLCGVSITWLTTPGTEHHPGCHRASCISYGLCFEGHVAIRCYPECSSRMSALPSRHSFQDDWRDGLYVRWQITGGRPCLRQRTTLRAST